MPRTVLDSASVIAAAASRSAARQQVEGALEALAAEVVEGGGDAAGRELADALGQPRVVVDDAEVDHLIAQRAG